ncbi:MAG TPA: transglutaminase domain-containing protein [Polyangia bacterium]|nr:transglutaminase domain-containing protein [Polyangia bacterium]
MARRAGGLMAVARRSTRLSLLVAAATVIGVAAEGGARAQVLHERVIVGGVRCANGVCWKEGRPADGAAGIVVDGEVVPAPSSSAQPAPDEPVYTPAPERAPADHSATTDPAVPGGSPERRGRVQMDRATGPEPPGKRLYHEPFNPAVFPFKRMTALDAVEPDESLVLAERSIPRSRLRVLGADKRADGRDAFWGSIIVDLEPGQWIPLPSVAADARILAASVVPPVEVSFARDGADNQYVMSPSGGRHRLVWLTDAPARYFAGEVPPDLRLLDEPRIPQAVPAGIRRRAAKVLARIGVDPRPTVPLARDLDELVGWFRAFEPGEPPRATDSLYEDLALAQKGSCRHRSYAFLITALALGIPARYVENELHVFVEVFVPRVGWRRINLGGALVDEEVSGADGKIPYQPKGGDPFPRPDAFAKGNDATPPAPKALEDAARNHAQNLASHAGGGAAAAGSEGGAGGNHRGNGGAGGAGGAGGPARGDRESRVVNLDALDREAPPGTPGARVSNASVPTSVTVRVAARDTFRGERIDVSGTVAAADNRPSGLPVEIYLDGPGGALKVGDAVADASGAWHATIEVPRDLPLGDHRVVARTPGDTRRKPSHSR